MVREWNKRRMVEVWREKIRKWKLIKRVVKNKTRRVGAEAFKKWVKRVREAERREEAVKKIKEVFKMKIKENMLKAMGIIKQVNVEVTSER